MFKSDESNWGSVDYCESNREKDAKKKAEEIEDVLESEHSEFLRSAKNFSKIDLKTCDIAAKILHCIQVHQVNESSNTENTEIKGNLENSW